MDNKRQPYKTCQENLRIIEWRCVNGHLLARFKVNEKDMVVSAKCHRCRQVVEKAVRDLN